VHGAHDIVCKVESAKEQGKLLDIATCEETSSCDVAQRLGKSVYDILYQLCFRAAQLRNSCSNVAVTTCKRHG